MLNQYNLKMPTNVFAGPDAMQNLDTIIKDGVKKSRYLQVTKYSSLDC